MKTQSNSSAFDYCSPDFVDQENGSVEIPGRWRRVVADVQGMMQLNNQGSNNFARIAKEVRDNFKEYFNFVQSSISLQDNVVNNPTNAFDEQYSVFGTMKLQLIKLIADKT